jgi:hypothetical protein
MMFFSKDVMERRLEQVESSSATTKSLRDRCSSFEATDRGRLPRQSESGRLMQARLSGYEQLARSHDRARAGWEVGSRFVGITRHKNALAFNLVGAEATSVLQCG